MWIQRDFSTFLQSDAAKTSLPIKVLKGPRQVGKTSLLDRLGTHKLIQFDDLSVRKFAQDNPKLFLEQWNEPIILDEVTLAPEIFPELKRRVDNQRRTQLKGEQAPSRSSNENLDIWITGSNQTLLQDRVRESLAGRASYFSLNTLSLHEVKQFQPAQATLRHFLMKGGWPELHSNQSVDSIRYLNDFMSTFIEKDIVIAAGIERKTAFSRALQLSAGRVGQLLNNSEIAKIVGVDLTTVQSWLSLLEQNGILKIVQPYYSNLNQRLIKTPKLFFEDVGICTRLQGWTEYEPLFVSPYFGNLIENLVFSEISRFFSNSGRPLEIFYLRSKEKVEVDFLLQLPNQRFIAIEVKASPVDFTKDQLKLLDSLQLNIIEKWIVSPEGPAQFQHAQVVPLADLSQRLSHY